jgi:hypothetical protein
MCAIFPCHRHPLECGSAVSAFPPQPRAQTILRCKFRNRKSGGKPPHSTCVIIRVSIAHHNEGWFGNLCTKKENAGHRRLFAHAKYCHPDRRASAVCRRVVQGSRLDLKRFEKATGPTLESSARPSRLRAWAHFPASTQAATIPAAPLARTPPSAVPSQSFCRACSK